MEGTNSQILLEEDDTEFLRLGVGESENDAIIGYHDGEKMYFFQGKSVGEIPLNPTEGGFGWDGIFVPTGYNKSYGQMTPDEKNKISQRSKALDELRKFFQKNK